jgi:nucleoside triphosphate pyrophosphatase
MTTRLILASQSPRRREYLSLLGLTFEATAADIDETPHDGEAPSDMVCRLSAAKARAVVVGNDGEPIVIAGDTVVSLDGDVLGKPQDPNEAADMLGRLRSRPHTVYSGVAVFDTGSGRLAPDLAATQVYMRDYSADEIAAYIASGDPFDKAGGYAIQFEDFHPVARIEGCYLNVVGLPLCHITRNLRRWGIEPRQDVPVACQAYTGRMCPVYEAILAGG